MTPEGHCRASSLASAHKPGRGSVGGGEVGGVQGGAGDWVSVGSGHCDRCGELLHKTTNKTVPFCLCPRKGI